MKKNNLGFFKRFHIIPKIFCVVVAFVIWLYVAAVESPDHEETIYDVPVSLVGVSAIESNHNLSVFSGYDITVDLSVKGQLSTINKYSADDYNVTADISKITEGGRYTINLSFDMPSGVTLSSSSAETADFYIDERTTAIVNVYPKLKSVAVSDNYELGELSSDTETVVVSGPKILVNEVDHAAVYLNAGSIDSSVTMIGQLTLVNLSGEDMSNPYLKLSKNEAKVTIPIYEYKELQVVVPTKYGYYNENNSKITVTPETIAVKGDPLVLDKYNSVSTTAIDETKISSDSTMLLGLQMPDNIALAEGEQSYVSVNIAHIGTTTKKIAVDDIKVKGAKNIDYSVQTASVNIVLRGKSKDLEKIQEKDIEAVVDLSGFSESSGVISAPLTITVKDSDGAVYAIGEYSVQIKIN